MRGPGKTAGLAGPGEQAVERALLYYNSDHEALVDALICIGLSR